MCNIQFDTGYLCKKNPLVLEFLFVLSLSVLLLISICNSVIFKSILVINFIEFSFDFFLHFIASLSSV